jgi:hypothetical protein
VRNEFHPKRFQNEMADFLTNQGAAALILGLVNQKLFPASIRWVLSHARESNSSPKVSNPLPGGNGQHQLLRFVENPSFFVSCRVFFVPLAFFLRISLPTTSAIFLLPRPPSFLLPLFLQTPNYANLTNLQWVFPSLSLDIPLLYTIPLHIPFLCISLLCIESHKRR